MANFVVSSHKGDLAIVGEESYVLVQVDKDVIAITLLCNERRYIEPDGVFHPEGFIRVRPAYYEYHFMTVGEF